MWSKALAVSLNVWRTFQLAWSILPEASVILSIESVSSMRKLNKWSHGNRSSFMPLKSLTSLYELPLAEFRFFNPRVLIGFCASTWFVWENCQFCEDVVLELLPVKSFGQRKSSFAYLLILLILWNRYAMITVKITNVLSSSMISTMLIPFSSLLNPFTKAISWNYGIETIANNGVVQVDRQNK